MDLRGKSVFLTGGARGLGRGIVEELLSLGAKVLFCDVNVEQGRVTEVELQKQYGADVVFFQEADVSDEEQHKAAFAAAVSKLGVVDICVNNAGISDENSWEKVLEVNTGAYIRGSLLALKHMRRDLGGCGGVIINVASLLGLMPMATSPVYAASKHAVVGFTTSWAMSPDQKEHGVRWCCLCPGIFNSELLQETLNSNRVYHVQDVQQYLQDHGVMPVSQVAQAVIKLIQDPDNNGAILEVSLAKGARYRRRQIVDRDGVSDLVVVDTY
ncbi:15-hydroxyprostaglandin dehydrogenase [NAD(+)]-like [Pomacea canaliculata]|nr:15-hydroxyprostaglandin dehydrogenase [NAD(+)]-like [Pomacea canaliculata]